ncbi:MAG TPA: 4'-phosphopantetheinyl transferase superfamily protein [Polyangiaceae bacterium]|nr:4'-phosphopantetheinyl transferase superfamily protein [Polyangiaceae bacterium]
MSLGAPLPALPLLLELGATIKIAGFDTHDHQAIIDELGALVDGAPERAVPKRRAEFLAGRWAARQALAALGVDGTPGRNEDGSPRWPAQTTGSITHGADRALSVAARVTDVRSLGIDAERLMKDSVSTELRARICVEEELLLLQRGLGQPQHHEVTFAFSAKESLYKCLHPLVGKFMDFRAARVVEARWQGEARARRGELTLELTCDWSGEFPKGRLFQAQFSASERHVESAVVLLA